MADNTISVEALELSVKTSSGSAADSVNDLVKALGKLKGKYSSFTALANGVTKLKDATKGGLGLTTASNQIDKFGSTIASSINKSRIDKIYALADAVKYLKKSYSGFRLPAASAIDRILSAGKTAKEKKNAVNMYGETAAERDRRLKKMVDDSYKDNSAFSTTDDENNVHTKWQKTHEAARKAKAEMAEYWREEREAEEELARGKAWHEGSTAPETAKEVSVKKEQTRLTIEQTNEIAKERSEYDRLATKLEELRGKYNDLLNDGGHSVKSDAVQAQIEKIQNKMWALDKQASMPEVSMDATHALIQDQTEADRLEHQLDAVIEKINLLQNAGAEQTAIDKEVKKAQKLREEIGKVAAIRNAAHFDSTGASMFAATHNQLDLLIAKSIDARNALAGVLNNPAATWTEKFTATQAVHKADADVSEYKRLQAMLSKVSPEVQRTAQTMLDMGSSATTVRNKLFNLDGELKQKPKDTKKASAGFAEMGKTLKNGRHAISDYIKNHTKLLRQFGRVAKMRAMRWAIRAITSGLKEGINNLYQYSKAMNGTFAGTMDAASSALLTMKNSIATAVAPLIEMLLPTLQKVVGWIREAANWLAQVFAQLNGQSTWTRAKDAVVEYAEATKEAKDNTKEMLASFDELNVIASESTGSGSGKKAVDYKTMFEDVATFDKSSTEWAERLRKIIDKAKEVFEWLKEKAKQIYPAIHDAFVKIAPVIKDFIDQIMPIVTEVIEVVTPIITEAVTWLAQAITDAWPTIKKVLEFVKEHINIILPAVLGIKAAIGGWNIAKHLIPNLTSIGTATSGILKNFNLLKAIGTIGIALAVDTTLTGLTGISALGMGAHIIKTLFTEGPAAFTRSGMNNPIAQWVSTQIGEDLTKQYLQDMGFNLSKAEAGLSVVNADGSVSLNKHAIEKLGKDAERAQELANIFAESMGTITQSGLDAQEFLNNLDLIVPMLQDKDLNASAKSILYAVKTYGKDWIFHLKDIGADTTTTLKLLSRQYLAEGKKLPQNLAKGIMNDKSFRQSLLSIAGIAKISVQEIEDIINNADLVMPIVQKYGYEKSVDIIKSIAFTAGKDTKYIIENWDLLAPYIDTEFIEQSVNDILKLIDKYGAEWQEHLDELHLNVGIGLSDTVNKISGLIKQYGKDWKKHLKELNLEADVNAEKTLKAVTVLIDKYGIEEWQKHLDELDLSVPVKLDDSGVMSGVVSLKQKVKEQLKEEISIKANVATTAGSGQTFGDSYYSKGTETKKEEKWDNSANIAPEGYSGYTGTTKTGNSALDAFLGTKTQTEVLMNLHNEYPKVFTKAIERIKTDSGKQNSKYLETFNLENNEVEWLREHGYTFKAIHPKPYGQGIRQITQRHTGGIGIPSGELFLANEGGVPEMIGRIGNQNAVVNNTQIIQGIAQGVASVMSGVERRLARIEQLTGVVADKDFSVKLSPSVGLARVNAQAAAMYSAVTGR